MKNDIYIYHHLGLGDHFHCNGVVRHLVKDFDDFKSINLFCKKKYYEMIVFMYRDLKFLNIIPITNFEKNEVNEVLSHVKKYDKIIKIGFDYFTKNMNKDKTVDMLFYEQFNLDYSKRFELTFWKRNINNENELFNKLVNSNNYIFVHDDHTRNFIIPDKFFPKDYQIIRNSNEISIFDYSKIIENASEIHVMESSARCMLEYLDTNNSKHYLYNFKNGPWKSIPFLKNDKIIGSNKNWNIINLEFKKGFLYNIKKIFS